MKVLSPKKRGVDDEEKGIALIITLGILAILIVVALAFVASARTSRKAAATHASVTGARLIAESALEKITGLIRYYNTHNGEIKVTELASSYASGEDIGTTPPKQDWLYRIFSGDTDADKAAQLTDASGDTTVEWEYLKIDGKIIGRVGYTVIADGKVNPARIVDNTTTYPNAMGGPPRDEADSASQLRLGIDVNEMCLADLPGMSTYVSNISDFNSNSASPAGKLNDNGNWPDIAYLCSQLGVTTATGKDKFKNDWFNVSPFETKEAFWCDDDGDGVIDANGTAAEGGTDNDDEMYCRFNLRRYVDKNGNGVYDTGDTNLWNDLNGDGNSGSATATNYSGSSYTFSQWGYNDVADVIYLLQDPKRIDDPSAGPNNTGGIMWIARWGKKRDGNDLVMHNISPWPFHEINGNITNAPSGLMRMKRTLAANIIDYCDKDDVPTSDVDPSHWGDAMNGTPWPSFHGHERTRYINEVMMAADSSFSEATDSTTGKTTFDYQVDFYLGMETINMFREVVPNTKVKNIYGEMTVTYEKLDGTKKAIKVPFSDPILTGATADTGGPHYDFAFQAGNTHNWTLSLTGTKTPGATPRLSFQITKFCAVLWQPTSTKVPSTPPHAVDCFVLAGSGSAHNTVHTAINGQWCDWHAYASDPRTMYNTLADAQIEWKDETSQPTLNPGNNPNSVPNSHRGFSKDRDTTPVAVDSAAGNYVQSAFIRDDIMKSPWELGLIPRGYPFQTLNLLEFNDNDNTVFDNKHMVSGGNVYRGVYWASREPNCSEGGDANILSQVKMQPEMSRCGLVNINTKEKDILKMLLSRIRVGQTDLDNFTSDGTELTSAQVDQLATAIRKDNGSYSYRSQVINALRTVIVSGPLAATFDTSAKREEIIGKFINLTGTTSNTYRIIILAQSIKDVGGATLSKDLNYDGKINATGATDTYDADGDAIVSDTIDETESTTLGTYDQMFDEITAEQKIAVDLAYDSSNNKWLILKYEYLDD